MSIALEERTIGHDSYKNMESIFQAIDDIIHNDATELTNEDFNKLERIDTTLTFLKSSLRKVDPWLVSLNTMTNINNSLSPLLGELTNFKNNRYAGHLDNALNHLENLITYFSQIVLTKTPEEIESVKSSVIKFRQSVGQYIANLEKDANDVWTTLTKNTEKLNELSSSIDNQKSRTDIIISELQNQFLQEQSLRSQEFNTFISEGEKDLRKNTKEFQEDFLSKTFEQQQEFDLLKQKYEEQIRTDQSSFDSFFQKQRLATKVQVEKIHEMNKEAEKILGLMSMKGLAQGYQKIANSEGKKAMVWNGISLLSIFGVLFFGYEFIIKNGGNMSWTALVSRIVLTGVGLTLFTYCAKQATNHRNEERRNRKIELELASLDPYLKDLEPDKQKEVKRTLVNKYFGVEVPITTEKQVQQKNIAEEIANNPQLLQTILTKVIELIPKGK